MARTPKKDEKLIEEYENNEIVNKTNIKPTGTNTATAKDSDKKFQ